MRISEKVKNLRRKEAEFKAKGDFAQAVHAKIIADFLEDYMDGMRNGVASAPILFESEVNLCEN